ncbi:hypothetical protein [Actinomadura verrucosospora]|uniref:Uncharacterized protein n=1 Tax=Actinomadura verrucosospora TaxID=46165 RepID=A0A7D3ZLU2_ACTVE|nr:hypothetical protein [Actinomadura verrucosospora]QKG21663.1 hypothetical protein ACTIVE_3301 [Actinomadura verrucosospora]
MLATHLGELLGATPPGVDEALDVVDGFDGALVHGFGRLGDDGAAALAALAGALGGSPLGGPAAEAAEKVAAGSVADAHLAALAGGRTALLGAVHDALLAHLDTALGRARAGWEPGGDVPDAAANLLAGCRSWLAELAIAGWRGVDHDLVSASDQAIEALLAEPALRRQAVLLDGLAAELRACSPVATMAEIPARRWADLWARGVLLAQPGGTAPARETVSGRLLLLGTDVHEHGTAIQVQAHWLLEPDGDGPPRLVRTSAAAAKVDTIVGPAVWRVLADRPVLLRALAEQRAVQIEGLTLMGGDLLWEEDKARLGFVAEPFATARLHLAGAAAAAVPPLERHPARIGEPVFLEGYTVDGAALRLGEHALEVDMDRLPACGPLTPELVTASSACIGLVRWDAGRWALQPLAVQATVKKKQVDAHNGDWALGPTDPKVEKAMARSGDTVLVLQERAGRLLRK